MLAGFALNMPNNTFNIDLTVINLWINTNSKHVIHVAHGDVVTRKDFEMPKASRLEPPMVALGNRQ